MIKSELVQKLAEQNDHLYHQHVEKIVNTVLTEIMNTLKDGGRVELRGFGTFSSKSRSARKGRNPRTGSAVEVDAKRAVAFKYSKDLHKRLNGTTSE